jgi:hypothetical protein
MIRTIAITLILTLCAALSGAVSLVVTTRDGSTTDVVSTSSTLKKKVVVLNDGTKLSYKEIAEIATADFDTYEKAVKRTSRPDNQHVTVRYTGEGNVDALRLAKLEKKRQGAGAARGAGGIMMLLGVISGSRELASAGLVTYGAGTIAKDVNTDKTIRAQNEAIVNLQKQEQLAKADDLEAQYRIEYGDENVDGLIALLDGNHKRALAFAGVAETSSDEWHRISAVWLEAIIYADMGDDAALDASIDKIIEIDPEIDSRDEADRWMTLLMSDLEELRKG